MAPCSPKVMLHPVKASRLRTKTEYINANITGRIGWARLIQSLRESGEFHSYEEVEAFVIDDDGISFFVKDLR